MNEQPSIAKLAAKLAKILGEVGKVPKDGKNEFHGYDYVTESALFYAVRDKLAAAGVFVFTSTESQHVEIVKEEDKDGKTRTTALTTVVTKHTFADGESGESFSVNSQGQGVDVGDKGGYKAITGAMKYFIYKNFMVPTAEDMNPEGDTKTDRREQESGSGREEQLGAKVESLPPERSRNVSVPRDPGVDEVKALRGKFEGGKWHTVKIHFGNDRGMTLASMDQPKLAYWINWKPKPFNGKFDPKDLELRAALDVADVEWK